MEKTLKLTDERKAELLGACPLFSGVLAGDLAAVAGRAVEIEFPADRVTEQQHH